MVVSIFLTSLRCDLAKPWLFIGEKCVGLVSKDTAFLTAWSVPNIPQMSRWQAAYSFDIFTELALFSVAIYMTLGLQLSFTKKLVVLLAFGLRLP